MRCPSCRQPAAEHLAVCAHCGFCLEAVDRALGAPPALAAPLADLAGALARRERAAALRDLRAFSHRFPQLSPVCVLAGVPSGVPVEIYAFWLFNRAGLFSISETGGSNHGLMLLLDPDSQTLAAMPGYGLEPFVGEDGLEPALAAARLSLAKGDAARAISVFFRETGACLARIAGQLPRVFGYDENRPWLDSSSDAGAAPAHDAEDAY